MYLREICYLRLAIKLAKSIYIKLVQQFTNEKDRNRRNRDNSHNFEGFKFKIADETFENKLTDVLEKFN